MKLSDFDYELPERLIAQNPAPRRDGSRLLVLDRASGALEHLRFDQIGRFLKAGDCLVVNDTRVFPARVFGMREGFSGAVEFLFTRRVEASAYEAMTRPAKKLAPGTRLALGESGAGATVEAEIKNGRRLIRFDDGIDPPSFFEREGHMPLPPYIHRSDTPQDRERYQTVFGEHAGAVAAPTAGLHFSRELMQSLYAAGVIIARVTLHVGPGTFVPVTAEDPREHEMEPEWYRLGGLDAQAVNRARDEGNRVIAVGTTAVRTLETVAFETRHGWRAAPGEGWTNAFIYPPYKFKLVDALITNFHLPKSSLLLLVSAFAGSGRIREAYRRAVEQEYRFYSYGDAMLIR